ncbi:Outer membrane protein beta-barrel domain-containing protein [Chitinophaga sp. CF118]|uniref:outer membrane beta-barrel protein n=1 Tax=Chitinophaga sp. CF118 TaxID=1884367 RepID=UPI0008F31C52|nr:outer membrane beta-barrel protein [Chitinophaga sp. CF118]SFE70901.1 Outer membrane protein beta-barrel domain-containing protein [Chitinophaga sp. CF118]
MRKFLLLFLFSLFTSQYLYAQVSLGIRGGFSVTAMKFETSSGQKSGGISNDNQLKSLHADLLLNVPLYGGFHLQPVLRYITKGTYFEPLAQQQATASGESGNRIAIRYLEMPVNLLYKFQFPGFKLAVGAGPYIAYALGGNYRTDIIDNGKIVSHEKRSLGFENADNVISPGLYLDRWDGGINTTIGLELNNLVNIGVNYSQGMINLDNSAAYKVKNSYVGISVGVLLSREDY